jgi:colanic acid biosynthesis glycosyl transferase WcaI
MRILFLSQWFEPEPAMKGTAFVQALRARGHHVEVVTGFPNYPGGKIYPGFKLKLFQRELVEGFTVNRLWLYPSHDRSAARRSLNYLSFFISSLIFGLFNASRFDVIYVYHPPVTPALAAALLGGLWGKPFVIDIQDLWPDSVSESGIVGSGAVARVLNAVCDFVYRRAARVSAQSNGMRRTLVQRGVPTEKLVTLYNWADEASVGPTGQHDVTPYGFEGRFNIVYAGNLGRAQALETLVDAARLAGQTNPAIQLLIIGNGVDREVLAEHIERGRGDGDNVRLMPGIPRSQIGDVLDAADVLVLHLTDRALYEITLPSKLQFYMAAGKPILVAVRGEASDLVVEHRAGLAAAPENPQAIAEAMIALAQLSPAELRAMGNRARTLYEENFSFAKAMDQTEAVLLSAAKGQS